MTKWISGIIGTIIAGIVVFHITQNPDFSITERLTQTKKTITPKSKNDLGSFHVTMLSDARKGVHNYNYGKISVFVTVLSETDGSPISDANVKIESDCAFFDETDSMIGWGKTDTNGRLTMNLIFGRKACGNAGTVTGVYPSRIYHIELKLLVTKDGYKNWQNDMQLNLQSGVAEILKVFTRRIN